MSADLVPFHPNRPTVEVLAQKTCTVTFTIPAGSREEMENAIADRLRSDTELSWKDTPEGVNVAVVSPSGVWRPRRRFSLGKRDGDGQ